MSEFFLRFIFTYSKCRVREQDLPFPGQTKSRSQELLPHFSYGLQSPKYLNCSTAFPEALSGHWIRSEAAKMQAYAYIECWLCNSTLTHCVTMSDPSWNFHIWQRNIYQGEKSFVFQMLLPCIITEAMWYIFTCFGNFKNYDNNIKIIHHIQIF